jgi:hypothetical protein
MTSRLIRSISLVSCFGTRGAPPSRHPPPPRRRVCLILCPSCVCLCSVLCTHLDVDTTRWILNLVVIMVRVRGASTIARREMDLRRLIVLVVYIIVFACSVHACVCSIPHECIYISMYTNSRRRLVRGGGTRESGYSTSTTPSAPRIIRSCPRRPSRGARPTLGVAVGRRWRHSRASPPPPLFRTQPPQEPRHGGA